MLVWLAVTEPVLNDSLDILVRLGIQTQDFVCAVEHANCLPYTTNQRGNKYLNQDNIMHT